METKESSEKSTFKAGSYCEKQSTPPLLCDYCKCQQDVKRKVLSHTNNQHSTSKTNLIQGLPQHSSPRGEHKGNGKLDAYSLTVGKADPNLVLAALDGGFVCKAPFKDSSKEAKKLTCPCYSPRKSLLSAEVTSIVTMDESTCELAFKIQNELERERQSFDNEPSQERILPNTLDSIQTQSDDKIQEGHGLNSKDTSLKIDNSLELKQNSTNLPDSKASTLIRSIQGEALMTALQKRLSRSSIVSFKEFLLDPVNTLREGETLHPSEKNGEMTVRN